jgi:LemA protein
MNGVYLFGLIISLIILYFLLKLNKMVRLKNSVIQSWDEVEVLLNKRYDLYNDLTSLIRNYSRIEPSLEKELARKGVQARHAFTVPDQQVAEIDLNSMVNRLIFTATNNSDIQSIGAFNDLIKEIAEMGTAIRNGIQYYNGSARDYNDNLAGIPSGLITRIFNFKPLKLYDTTLSLIVENEGVRV